MTPAELKSSFDANGYLVVPDVVTGDALAELRTMVDRVLDGDLPPQRRNRGGSLDDYDIQWEPGLQHDVTLPRRERVRVVFHLCHTHDFFWQHATRPEILDVIEALIGPDITLYTDQMFVKPARHGTEVPFHQDSGYWPWADPPHLLSCWFAIDDVTIANGCVHMLPGSHKALLPHRHFEGPQSHGLLESDVDASRETPIEMAAGSMCIHHSLTVHRSFANRSDRGRRGLVTIYLPSSLRVDRDWDFPFGFKTLRGRSLDECAAKGPQHA